MEWVYDHASFYSALVTEWLGDLESSGSTSVELRGDWEVGEGGEGFDMETVGRAEMHEQRQMWEDIVFSDADVQADAIRAYLDDLFTRTALSQLAFRELRKTIKSFATGLSAKKTWLTVDDLERVSVSLLKTDLLTKEKMVILKELMRNQAVAQEVADVLNMRLASLDSWSWPGEGVPVEMRRQLNGKYRVFMAEDLLGSLIFQYLGLRWSVTFRSAFVTFLDSRGWKTLRENIPEQDKLRRSYFLGSPHRYGVQTVNEERQKVIKKEYFMTQLPASVAADVASYDDDDGNDDENRPQECSGNQALPSSSPDHGIHRTHYPTWTVYSCPVRFQMVQPVSPTHHDAHGPFLLRCSSGFARILPRFPGNAHEIRP